MDVIETVGVNRGLTVMIVGLDVALVGEAHKSDETILTVTLSPFTSEVLEKVGLFAPGTFDPFILHWYVGVDPPFTGFAVNNIDVPAQIVVALAETETLGTMVGLIVTGVEIPETVVGEAQRALLVKSTDTTSPPVKLLVENVF